MEWFPKLVGIERSIRLRLGGGSDAEVIRCLTDEAHQQQLTREDVTAAVHYIRFELTPAQVERFAAGPVTLRVDHPYYHEETPLAPGAHAALLEDLRD